jgi:hypothetical protein
VGLLSPLNLLYGASLIALAIIYFRSRSRPTLKVPSLLVFDEQPAPVASAGRFRTDLLFWLEAIALAALVLSVAGLYANAPLTADRSRRRALVFDIAAAMGAREDHGTRLDLAKREAFGIVDRASADERFAVIAYAMEASAIRPSTGNLDSVRRAILALKSEAVPMRPAAFYAAIMAAREADRIEVFSDRLPQSALTADIAGKVRFHQVGSTDDNAAIVELNPGAVNEAQGYCVVRNFSARPRLCQLEIINNAVVVDRSALMLSRRAQALHRFGPLTTGGLIEARLTSADALADDDSRYAYAPVSLPVKVAVVSPDSTVRDELARVLLAVNENFVITAVDPLHIEELVAAPQRGHDQWALIVMHDCFDSRLKGRARLIIFPPASSGFASARAAAAGQIQEIAESDGPFDPLSAGLSQLRAPVSLGAIRTLKLTEAMEVIASGSARGVADPIPVAAIGRDAGGRVGVIAFDIRGDRLMDPDRSESLLITIKLIKELSAPSELQIVQTGGFAAVTLDRPSAMTAPDGSRVWLTPQAGVARFRPKLTGLYTISAPDGIRRMYVNYYDASESDIRIRPVNKDAERALAHQTSAPPRTAEARRLAPILVWIATAAVLIESILLARKAWLLRWNRV